MYFILVVQGSKASPEVLNQKIDEVILQAKEIIINLNNNQLEEFKNSIKIELRKPDNNIKERSDRIWREISEGTFEFNRRETLYNELQFIKKKRGCCGSI